MLLENKSGLLDTVARVKGAPYPTTVIAIAMYVHTYIHTRVFPVSQAQSVSGNYLSCLHGERAENGGWGPSKCRMVNGILASPATGLRPGRIRAREPGQCRDGMFHPPTLTRCPKPSRPRRVDAYDTHSIPGLVLTRTIVSAYLLTTLSAYHQHIISMCTRVAIVYA